MQDGLKKIEKVFSQERVSFLSLFFLLIAFEYPQIYTANKVSLFFLALSMLFSLVDFLFFILLKRYESGELTHLFLFISEVFALAIFSSCDYSLDDELSIHIIKHIQVDRVIIDVMLIVHAICLAFHLFYRINRKGDIWKNLGISVLFFAISFLLNLNCLEAWPRWDTYCYYNAVDNITISNFFMDGELGLSICGHISSAFAVINIAMKELLQFDLLQSMYAVNLLLVFFDALLFYYIFKILLPEKNEFFYIFFSLASIFSPYIWGTVYVINTERLLSTALLLFICGYLYENKGSILFATYICCNTKEVGVVAVAAMLGVLFVKQLLRKDNKSDIVYYMFYIIIGGLWFLHYLKLDWAELIKNDVQETFPMIDGTPFNAIGISFVHITDTIEAQVLTNFTWIFCLLIILAVIKYLVCFFKSKKIITIKSILYSNFTTLLIGFLAYETIICLFVTYHFYRYYTEMTSFVYIAGFSALAYLLPELNATIMGLIMGGFLLVQSYITIDPIMLLAFDKIETGNAYLSALPMHMTQYNEPGFQDNVTYNRQIMYFDKALDKAFALIGADTNKMIYVSDEFVLKEGLGALYSIWGYGYQYVEPKYYGKYDARSERRYLDKVDEGVIELKYMNINADFGGIDRLNEAYYIRMPWKDDTLDALMQRYPAIHSIGVVSYGGWNLEVYKLVY